MGSLTHHFNDRSNSAIASLDAQVDRYTDLQTPTSDQTRQMQEVLAKNKLFPQDRIDGHPSELMNYSMAVVSDTDLAQRALIGFQQLAPGTATPDQNRALEISLNRLGYPSPLDGQNSQQTQTALKQYQGDYPLPLSEIQIEVVATEVGGKIPLDVKDGKIGVRDSAAPDLIKTQLAQMDKYNQLARPLDEKEITLLNQTVIGRLGEFSQPVPQLNDAKLADLKSAQPAQRPVILRATPDEVSEGSSLPMRIEMRASWEAGNSAIEAAGGRVAAIDGSSPEGGKREVFTRDRFIMVGSKAYLPDITMIDPKEHDYPVYKSEIDQARKTLQDKGIETVDVQNSWFEGGNIIQHDKSKTIFMGLAPQDDPQSAQNLISKINETQPEKRSMVAVPLVEYDRNGVYHLDLAMSEPLANGKMLFDENITDSYTRDRVEDIVGHDNIIPITREEAISGSANILQVGDTALMTNVSDRLAGVLNKEGVSFVSAADFKATGDTQIDQDLDKNGLSIGNGGMHCMGQKISSEPNPNFSPAPQPAPALEPAI